MGFWLSHHHADEHHRTYLIGRARLCARCFGLYPLLALGLLLQFRTGAPLHWRLDTPFVLALTLPALLDWAVGRFRPHVGSNPFRSATGALLGIALARSLYVHLQSPWPTAMVLQAALVIAVALPIILKTYRRPTNP